MKYVLYLQTIKNQIKMKKIVLVLAVTSAVFYISCGGSKKEETAAAIPGMTETELVINGNHYSMMIPDSTKGRLEITEQSWGATEIKVGKEFQLSISEGEGDIALTKSDIAGNDVNKFKRYVKDEPTLLFWESEITQPESHFYMVQKAGTASFVVEDIKGEMYSEKAVQIMIDAALTIKAKETKPNS